MVNTHTNLVGAKKLNEFQAADALGTKVSTLRRWRLLGRGPRYVKIGGKLVRYLDTDLAAWLSHQATGGEKE